MAEKYSDLAINSDRYNPNGMATISIAFTGVFVLMTLALWKLLSMSH